MSQAIVVLAILLCMSVVGLVFYRMAKSSGRDEKEVEHAREAIELQKDENSRLADRPRSMHDASELMQRWIDKLRRN